MTYCRSCLKGGDIRLSRQKSPTSLRRLGNIGRRIEIIWKKSSEKKAPSPIADRFDLFTKVAWCPCVDRNIICVCLRCHSGIEPWLFECKDESRDTRKEEMSTGKSDSVLVLDLHLAPEKSCRIEEYALWSNYHSDPTRIFFPNPTAGSTNLNDRF